MKNLFTSLLMFICLISAFAQVDKSYSWVSGSGAPTHTPNLNYDSEKYWDYTNMKTYCYDRFNGQWEIDQDHPPVSISGLSNPALSSSGVNSQILTLDFDAGSSYNNSAACGMTATSIQAAIDELSCRTGIDNGGFSVTFDTDGNYEFSHDNSDGSNQTETILDHCNAVEALPVSLTPSLQDHLSFYAPNRDECTRVEVDDFISLITSIVGGDTSWAGNDLTLTGNRSHDGNGKDLFFSNFNQLVYSNTDNFFSLVPTASTLRHGSGSTQSQLSLSGGAGATSTFKSGDVMVLDVGGDLRIKEDTWASTPDGSPLLKTGSTFSGDNYYASYNLPLGFPTITNPVMTYDGSSVVWGSGAPKEYFVGIVEFMADKDISDRNGLVRYIVPNEQSGFTLSTAKICSETGSGTSSVNILVNGSTAFTTQFVTGSNCADFAGGSITLSASDRISILSTGTSGSVQGLSATIKIIE